MNEILLICEGENDRIFLHETIIKNLTIDSSQIKQYSTPDQFDLDLQNNRLRIISILEGGGYPNYIKLAVKYSKQFWNMTKFSSIGVIGDSDRGNIFTELNAYLTQLLNTPCKKHAINPQITVYDALQKIEITLRKARQIVIWTMQIPESLERQLTIILKIKHPKFKSEDNPHVFITNVSNGLKLTKEELIRTCVNLLKPEQWFNALVLGLKKNIRIPQ